MATRSPRAIPSRDWLARFSAGGASAPTTIVSATRTTPTMVNDVRIDHLLSILMLPVVRSCARSRPLAAERLDQRHFAAGHQLFDVHQDQHAAIDRAETRQVLRGKRCAKFRRRHDLI